MASRADVAGADAPAPLARGGSPPKAAPLPPPSSSVHLVLLHHGLFGSADHLDALQAHLVEHLQARRDGRPAIPGTAPLPPLSSAAAPGGGANTRANTAPRSPSTVLILNCTASEGRATIDGIDVCGERLADLAVDAARALAGPRGGAALASLPARAAVFPVAAAASCSPDLEPLLTPTNSLCPQLSADLLLRLLPPGSRVTRLSLVGYSMGGLVARYAAGLLYARGFFSRPPCGGDGDGGGNVGGEEDSTLDSEDEEEEEEERAGDNAGARRRRKRGGWGEVRAGALVAIATPNLGSFRPPGAAAYFNELFNTAVPWVASRTGHQLMLLDADLCAAHSGNGGQGGSGNTSSTSSTSNTPTIVDTDAFLGGWPAWLWSTAWAALLSQLRRPSSSSSAPQASRFAAAAVPAQPALPPTALGAPPPSSQNNNNHNADDWAPSPPLLALMAAPRHAFWRALALFERRALVANIRWDASVPYCTAAVALRNPFRGGNPALHEPVDPAMPTIVRLRGGGTNNSGNGNNNGNGSGSGSGSGGGGANKAAAANGGGSGNGADGLGLPDDSAPGQSGLMLKAAGGEVEEEGGQPRPYQGLRALIVALLLAIPLALPALAVAALRGARHHRAAALARAGGALAAAKERAAQAAAAAAADFRPGSSSAKAAAAAADGPAAAADAAAATEPSSSSAAAAPADKKQPPPPITKAAPPREGMAWALRRRYDEAELFASVARASGGATGALVASRLLFNARPRSPSPLARRISGAVAKKKTAGGGGGGGGLSHLSPWATAAATVAAATAAAGGGGDDAGSNPNPASSRPPTSLASVVSLASSAWPSEASSSGSEDDNDDALSGSSFSGGDNDDDDDGNNKNKAAARLSARQARERARRERRRFRELRAARRLLRRWRGPWAPEAQEFRRQRGLRAPLPALEGDVVPAPPAPGGGDADAAGAPPPLTPPGTVPPHARRPGRGLFRLGVVGAAPAHRVALERVCSLGGGEPSGYASPAPAPPGATTAGGGGGGLGGGVGGGSLAGAALPVDAATAEFERAADAAAAEAEAAAAAGNGNGKEAAPPAAAAMPPGNRPASSSSNALANAHSAALLAQQLAQQLPVLLSPAQQRARRRRRAQDAAERLHAAQRWMAARLRALKWERADVCAYHYQAHASIVLRDQRFFGMPRDTLEFAARQVFGVGGGGEEGKAAEGG
jgi:hypothetical protein